MGKSYSSIKPSWQNSKASEVGGSKKRKNFEDIHPEDYDFGVDEEYVNRFLSNSQNYLNNLQNAAQSYEANQKYGKDINDWGNLNDQRNTIQAYMNSRGISDDASSLDLKNYLDAYNKASRGANSAYKDLSDYYSQFGSQQAYDKFLEMSKNKADADSMSLDELRQKASEQRSTGASAKLYEMEINERLAQGLPVDDLYEKRDQANKEAQKRVLYYDQNGNAVTYDRLYREKVAENTWTNLTSDTEAYNLYEKIREESPDAEAEIMTGGDGKLLAQVLADKDVLAKMGYNYDEISYYQKYKADREGYQGSIEGAEDTTPLKAALFNIASAPLAALEYADNAFYSAMSLGKDDSAYGLANIYDDKFRNQAQIKLQSATQMIQEHMQAKGRSQLATWLVSGAYSGVVSSLQSAAQVATCRILFGDAGTAISLALMSSNAANQQFAESIKAGATNGEALATSIGAGINEALFEKLSIENLDGINKMISSQRWDYAGWREFFKTVVQNSPSMLTQGLVEGSEELFTDIANAIWDQYINGSNSAYQRSIKEYMDQGYDSTVAGRMATRDFFTDLASSFYGGMIGGLGTGQMHIIGGTAQLTDQYTRQAAKLGRAINENNNYDVLLQQTQELGDASVSRRANKLYETEAPSNRQIGRLAQEVYAKENRQMVSESRGAFADEIRNALRESGAEDPNAAAEAITKEYFGERMTTKERQLYEKVKGKEIVEKILSDDDIKERIINRSNVEKNQQRLYETARLADVDVKEAASADGSKSKTAIENAERKAKIEAKSVQEAKEITADNYMRSMGYLDSTRNAVLADIKEAGENIKDISTYLLGVNEAINYGKIGYQQKFIKDTGYYNTLADNQKNFAYNLGVTAAKEQLALDQKKRDARLGNMSKKTGAVHMMASTDGVTLNNKQSSSIDALTYIAQKVTHNNVYLYASHVGEDGKYHVGSDMYGINGFSKENDLAPNGMYMDGKGDIYIDINAGNKGEGVILMTASHELTHFIKEWSPAKFKTLADFLIDSYGEKGVSVESLIKDQIAKAEAAGQTLTYDQAYEEMVADSMEKMLTDERVYDKILELKAKDQSLFTKLREKLAEIIASVKEAFADINAQTQEGQFVSEMVDSLERLSDLFAEALVDAGETYGTASGVEGGSVIDNAYSDTQYSIRPPFSKGQRATDWVEALSPEARKTYDLFENLHDIGWGNKVDLGLSDKVDISGRYMTAQTWNDLCESNPEFKKVAKMLSAAIPKEYKASVNLGGKWLNDDGTMHISEMEEKLKMKRSLVQRVIDSMPLEKVSSTYEINGKEYKLADSEEVMSVGGDAYRRALLETVRERYRNGELKSKGTGSLAMDTWGALGWIRGNQKTTATGDFSTLCPQMFYNMGCWYCYRRSALETNVDNANVGTNIWYTGEILYLSKSDIDNLNKSGGLRIQSFGDWFDHYASQLADVMADAQERGLQIKIVTKEPSMIEAVAKLKEQGLGQNVYFNISADYTLEEQGRDINGEILSRNPDRPWMRKDGKVYWKRALTVEEAYELRKKYPWVNVRIVATTQDEFIQGLKDPRVQVVTGYHGRTRGFTRTDSVTGETYREMEGYTRISSLNGDTLVEVEPLGDHGMPSFKVVDDKWAIDYEGKNASQQSLAKKILAADLCSSYYAKTCCTTGNCQECQTTCGLSNFANDFQEFMIKNAFSQPDEIAYWQSHLKGGKNYQFKDLLTKNTGERILEDLRNDEVVKYSFRGENAANLTDADRKNLADAKKMLDRGVSMEEIFKKTGWYTQSDGKWRNEISNKGNRLDVNGLEHVVLDRYNKRINDIKKAFKDGKIDKETYDELIETAKNYLEKANRSGKLDTFLDAPELFAAYPQLKNVSLFFEALPNKTIAQADLDKRAITIDLDRAFINDEDVRETLLHEIQHFIQEYEGFSSGSNLSGGSSSYWNAGGEIEARDVEARTKWDDTKRRENMPAKFSTRDSLGRNLTNEQQEYFKDSVVRDDQGQLLRVYHGSPATDITTFDRSKAGQHTGSYSDNAIWFTTDEKFADDFSYKFEEGSSAFRVRRGAKGKVYEGYLNMTNPFDFNNLTDEMKEILYEGADKLHARHNIVDEYIEYQNHQALKMFLDFDQLEELGYDGVIARLYTPMQNKGDALEYGIFNSNQVKSVDNENPTENPDIRYSNRDSEGSELSKDQQKYFADSKVRDEDGNLLRVYHGTDASFTVFDKTKGRSTMDIQGSFFSPWELDAEGYGSNVEAYYLNITNPAPESVAYKALNRFKGQNNAGIKAREYLESLGYDGVNNSDEEYIAFNPEQIKRVDNLEPTGNIDVRYSSRTNVKDWNVDWDSNNFSSLRSQLNAHLDEVNSMNVVTTVDITDISSYLERLRSILKKWGYKISRSDSGDILFDEKAIAGIDKYINTDAERAAAIVAPYVLKRGKMISGHKNHKNQGYPSVSYAAPVVINGKRGNVIACVLYTGKDRVHSIRILMPNGKEYVFEAKKDDSLTPMGAPNGVTPSISSSSSNKDDTTLDGKVKDSLRDPSMRQLSDRELLMNATEPHGEIQGKKLAEFKEKGQLLKSLKEDLKKSTDRDMSTKLRNRIDVVERQVVALEKSKALQDVLSRERQSEEAKRQEYLRGLDKQHRERMESQRKALQAEFRERTNKARERRTAAELRHRITKRINELNRLLLNPDSKHHVPKDMRSSVEAALEMLDLENPRQGENTHARLAALKKMYDQIKNSSEPAFRYAYDEVIADMIDAVSEEIGDTPFYQLNSEQLESVYQMYSAVMATIRNANKTFTWMKKQDIAELSEDVMSEIKKIGGSKELTNKNVDKAKKFFYWDNMKPVYAMRAIGSETFSKLFDNVRRGEDTYARDITEAKERFRALAEKYGYEDWDLDERYEFKTSDGRSFTLNLMEMMSLYEYYKRPQADAHLAQGGFVFEDNTIKKKNKLGIKTEYKINNAQTHRVTPQMMAEISRKLTADQKGFADEMQSYLAHEMGAKGNEISEALYDIDLYGEEHYFPLKSSKIYLASKSTETAGDAQIKNMGASKKLIPHANNPIILRGLMDVWADHVNEMSMYHAFVLPLEDFQRVYNYTTPAADTATPEGVKSAIVNAYGDAAVSYIKTMLTDLNGGARSDNRVGMANKLIGAFKKGAVFASASVVIQQPSAVARAWAYIDPKYFVQTALENANLKNHSAQWEELKRYAPVAIIKEMGHFDTGLGASTQDWMKQTQPEGFMNKAKALIADPDYRDEILSKAPELADEITWTHIWNAAKAQVLAENEGLMEGSQEHLEKAGKLFTDTIVNTQVYDSVLSRSAHMRSKDTWEKMATSFMAEPTTSINMIIDAFTQAKRLGNGKEARRIIGSVLAQIILNSALVAIVYAARDDDDNKTYAEKYIGQLAGNTLESANPMNMIPILRDVMSLMQGYDVERADMSVISDVINAYRKLTSGEMSSKKIIDFINQVAKIFGVPSQNITRDVRAIRNVYEDIVSDNKTSIEGIRDSVLEEVTGKSTTQQYKSRLQRAIKSGDTAKIRDAIDKWVDQKVKLGKTEKEARSAIQSSLTSTYKPLFLKAYQKGDQKEMARIRRALNATGIYKDVVKTTQEWIKNSKQ